MAHFRVTRIWCEKVGTKNCYMYRFQKVDMSEPSWWMPAVSPPSFLPTEPVQAARGVCLFCLGENEQIYTAGWMCLNERCPAFWTIGLRPPQGRLVYSPDFLGERTAWDASQDFSPPFLLVPPLLVGDETAREWVENPTFAVSRLAWRGIVCPRCGRCNARTEWFGWRCQTESCDFQLAIPMRPVSQALLGDPFDTAAYGHTIPSVRSSHHIPVESRPLGNYRITTVTIPGCGVVAHIQPNRRVLGRTKGPHDMFRELQTLDIGLKRHPLANSLGK